jgi:hypothetical protein
MALRVQVRPESDKVMQDIADYVHNYEVSHSRTHSGSGEEESNHAIHARRSSRTSRTTRRASA